jgi:hypothetical protein
MSSPYSHHRGRTIGRLMHCIKVYNEGYTNLDIDWVQYGSDKVEYRGKARKLTDQFLANRQFEGQQ